MATNEDNLMDERVKAAARFHERVVVFDSLIQEIAEINNVNGWFDKPRSFGEGIALIHSEVSELLEARRNGDKDNEIEEFADIFIRLFDELHRQEWNGFEISEALEKKLKKNRERGYRHGGKAL